VDRAGYGEFDTADGSNTVFELQHLFLFRAGKLVPEFLESLIEIIEGLPQGFFQESIEFPGPMNSPTDPPEWLDDVTIHDLRPLLGAAPPDKAREVLHDRVRALLEDVGNDYGALMTGLRVVVELSDA